MKYSLLLFCLAGLTLHSLTWGQERLWTSLSNNDLPALQKLQEQDKYIFSKYPVMGYYFSHSPEIDQDVLSFLITAGADINLPYRDAHPIVIILERDLHIAEQCLNLFFNRQLPLDNSVLLSTFSSCNLEAMKIFISQDLRILEADALTLMQMAFTKNNLALAGMLLEKACYPSVLNSTLYEAVKQGRLAWVELLFAKGADIYQLDSAGTTLLDLARVRKHQAVVDFLLRYGASLDIQGTLERLKEVYQLDDLQSAESLLNSPFKEELGSQAMNWAMQDRRIPWITSLYFKGIPVNRPVQQGVSYLFQAYQTLDKDMVEVLSSLGAVLHPAEQDTALPLLYTLDRPQDLALLKQLSSPEILDGMLLRAVEDGRLAWVQALLARDAKLSVTNTQGYTPLLLALEKGYTNIIREILLRDELHDNTLQIFIRLYPAYDLIWASILGNKKDILRFCKKNRYLNQRGPGGRSAMQLYLLCHGGNPLHWFVMINDLRSIQKLGPLSHQDLYGVDAQGRKPVDLSESDSITAYLHEYMY